MVVSLSEIAVLYIRCEQCHRMLNDRDGEFTYDGILLRIVGYCKNGILCRERMQTAMGQSYTDTADSPVTGTGTDKQ